jgi:endonuclease/exonuclease/phosphatase family metal-dependent hydrolase
MTFNIRFDNPDDGSNAWPHRRDWVAEIIRTQRIDIAGLQEVLKSQLDDLRARLPDYEFYGVGRDDGRDAGEFGPVCFRRDRFDVMAQGEFWLSDRPEQPGRRDWGAACARMVTWTKLHDRTDDSSLTFFNTHFDHQSERAREHSARLLRERMPPRGDRTIVAGDFNCRHDSAPIRMLTDQADNAPGSLRDTYDLAGDRRFGPDSTWTGFTEIVPGQRIDMILVSDGWEVLQHRILDDQREGRFPSDHLPVVIQLRAR